MSLYDPDFKWDNAVDTKEPELAGNLHPLGWQIIAMPRAPQTKTKGGILMTQETIETNELLARVGKVLAVGSLAYTREDLAKNIRKPQVGDWIEWKANCGIPTRCNGVKLLYLTDTDILGIRDNPDSYDQLHLGS